MYVLFQRQFWFGKLARSLPRLPQTCRTLRHTPSLTDTASQPQPGCIWGLYLIFVPTKESRQALPHLGAHLGVKIGITSPFSNQSIITSPLCPRRSLGRHYITYVPTKESRYALPHLCAHQGTQIGITSLLCPPRSLGMHYLTSMSTKESRQALSHLRAHQRVQVGITSPLCPPKALSRLCAHPA